MADGVKPIPHFVSEKPIPPVNAIGQAVDAKGEHVGWIIRDDAVFGRIAAGDRVEIAVTLRGGGSVTLKAGDQVAVFPIRRSE